MKSRSTKLILLIVLLIVVVLQFIPVDRSVPADINADNNFLVTHDLDPELVSTLKQACFDCHSYKTRYPWYAYVAPVSFVVQNHVDEGRSELNFDEWGSYSQKKQDHKLEEIAESLRDKWMPLEGYVALHKNAKLSDSDREQLAAAIDELR